MAAGRANRKSDGRMGCGTILLWVFAFPVMLVYTAVKMLIDLFSELRQIMVDPSNYGTTKNKQNTPKTAPWLFGEHYDRMPPAKFQAYCAGLLQKCGFADVKPTDEQKKTGIHVIARANEAAYAFSCIRKRRKIGSKAVKKAALGKKEHEAQVGIVLTNTYFTLLAQSAAKRAGIVLWGRLELRALEQYAETNEYRQSRELIGRTNPSAENVAESAAHAEKTNIWETWDKLNERIMSAVEKM